MRLRSILCKAAVFAVSIFFGVQVYSAEAQSRLKFAYSSVGSMATGVWMAKESGAFDKYGIQADIIFISSGPVVVQALLGGDLLGGSAASNAVINAVLNGAPIVAVGGTANRPYHRLFVQPEINRLEDLKGKTLGVTRFGSITDNLTRILLRKNALEGNVNVRQMGGTMEVAAAFQNRQIAGAVTGELRGPSQTVPKILVNLVDMGIPYSMNMLAVSRDSIEAQSGNRRGNCAGLCRRRCVHEPQQGTRAKDHRQIRASEGCQANRGSLSRLSHVSGSYPTCPTRSCANDPGIHG